MNLCILHAGNVPILHMRNIPLSHSTPGQSPTYLAISTGNSNG